MGETLAVLMTLAFVAFIIIVIVACWILFYGAIFYIIFKVLEHIGLIGINLLL